MNRIKAWWEDNGGFWRVVAIAAIVFEAGISGTWLSEQMRNPLPYWWGFLGAGALGLSTFGGVNLAQKGNPKGWIVVIIGLIAGFTLSSIFFGDKHNLLIQFVMGIFPTGIGVMSGLIDSNQSQISTKEKQEREDREFQKQLKIKELEFQQQRLLEQDQLKAQVKIEQVKATQLPPPMGWMTGQPGQQNGHDRTMSVPERTYPDKSEFPAWLRSKPDATGADIAAAFGVDERTGRRWKKDEEAKATSK